MSEGVCFDRSRGAGALAKSLDDVRSWLYGQALPFWGQTGVDGVWGFVEHLSVAALPLDDRGKRLRVQARQIYTFSHASLLGYKPGIDVARTGWDFMRLHGWRTEGGWARVLGRRGGVLDSTLDLYDQAFALLAIAWWMRASGEDETALADRTLAAIDARLKSPHLGWRSEDAPGGALLQNPHMHLLEALLALYTTTGEARFRQRVEDTLVVFNSALFDSATGTVAEYYGDGWQRVSGDRGSIVEPGHHYEWIWLLHQAERVIPGSAACAEALFDFAEHYGSDRRTGLVYDEVFADGTVRAASHRTWPNTEALKAHLARFESVGTLDVGRVTQILDNLLGRFLATPFPGTWIDRLGTDLVPSHVDIPASTLYHVFVAFSELLRLEPLLRSEKAGARWDL